MAKTINSKENKYFLGKLYMQKRKEEEKKGIVEKIRFCPHCRTQLPKDAISCPKCGARLDAFDSFLKID